MLFWLSTTTDLPQTSAPAAQIPFPHCKVPEAEYLAINIPRYPPLIQLMPLPRSKLVLKFPTTITLPALSAVTLLPSATYDEAITFTNCTCPGVLAVTLFTVTLLPADVVGLPAASKALAL